LIESQLAGYKNLRDAYSKLVDPVAVPGVHDTKNAKCNLWRLKEGLGNDEVERATVYYWEDILGLKASDSGDGC
jgi:hypothetical protein